MGTVVYAYFNGFAFEGIDDANIYFVYMKHLSQGEGFVYNNGAEQVEGFSSLSWCVMGSVFFFLFEKPWYALLATNILLLSYSLWRFVWAIKKEVGSGDFFSVFLFWFFSVLFFIPGFFDWNVLSLLETGLWTSLLLLGFVQLISLKNPQDVSATRTRLSFLLVLMLLTRPEAMVWGMGYMLLYTFRLYGISHSFSNAAKKSALLYGVYFSSILLLIFWRVTYFGYPFPNTYYAKVSQDPFFNAVIGVHYLVEAVKRNNPLLLFFPVALFFCLVLYRKMKNVQSILIPLFVLSGCLFLIPLYTGGDHFNLSRFLQPGLAFVYTFIFLVFGFLFSMKKHRLLVAYGLISLLLILVLVLPQSHNFVAAYRNGGAIRHEFDLVKSGKNEGELLNRFFNGVEPLPSQGILTAGALAFAYDGVSYDLLGLNDVEMAHAQRKKPRNIGKNHASFSKEVFFKKQPDLFWLSAQKFVSITDTASFELTENRPDYQSDFYHLVYQDIVSDSGFISLYAPVFIAKPGEELCLFVYARNAFLKQLPAERFSYRLISRVKKEADLPTTNSLFLRR